MQLLSVAAQTVLYVLSYNKPVGWDDFWGFWNSLTIAEKQRYAEEARSLISASEHSMEVARREGTVTQ